MSPFLIRFTLILHILYLFSIDLEQHKDPECNSWGKHGWGLLSCCLLKLKTPRFLICFFIKFAFHCVPVRWGTLSSSFSSFCVWLRWLGWWPTPSVGRVWWAVTEWAGFAGHCATGSRCVETNWPERNARSVTRIVLAQIL